MVIGGWFVGSKDFSLILDLFKQIKINEGGEYLFDFLMDLIKYVGFEYIFAWYESELSRIDIEMPWLSSATRSKNVTGVRNNLQCSSQWSEEMDKTKDSKCNLKKKKKMYERKIRNIMTHVFEWVM